MRRSDQTLKQCSPSVRSEGDPASSPAKTMKIGSTRLWLRLVNWDRTHSVVIPGVLDLSGIDRTLGGSVRSLPLERPVNRKHAFLGLLLHFLFCLAGEPLITQRRLDLPRIHAAIVP